MKPPARAIVGNLIWSTDGGVWAVWRVTPFAHAHTATADKLAVHARLRGLLIGLPPTRCSCRSASGSTRWTS